MRALRTRVIWGLNAPAGLAIMFSVGLLVRLLIAPRTGYYADLKTFQAWADRLGELGAHRFYAETSSDYPPGYLYVLWLLGKISAPPGFVLVKLPAILGDLALAWIAGNFARCLAPSVNERVPVRPLVAAAVLFNPAVVMDSTVWGQVDVVPSVFVLWSLMLLFIGPRSLRRDVSALVLFALAFAIKPQSCFVLPVMLYALYRHHLHGRSRSELPRRALMIAVPGASALAIWFLLALPFGLGPVELLRFYGNVASEYPVTSAHAFNLWGAVGYSLPDSSGIDAIEFHRVSRGPVALAGVPAYHLGILLFAAAAATVVWRAHRALQRGADDARVLIVAAAAVSLLAFALLTRMHERYMFYALAFLAPLVFVRPLRLMLTVLSGIFVLNLWWVYAYNNSRADLGHSCALPAPGCVGMRPILGGFAFDAWQKKALSIAVVAIGLAIAALGVACVRRTQPDQEDQSRARRPGSPRPAAAR